MGKILETLTVLQFQASVNLAAADSIWAYGQLIHNKIQPPSHRYLVEKLLVEFTLKGAKQPYNLLMQLMQNGHHLCCHIKNLLMIRTLSSESTSNIFFSITICI